MPPAPVGTLGFVQTGPGGLTEARLRTLYVENGLSKKAIARELGCSDTTVAAAVRHFRLSRPERPEISEQDRQLIVERYKSERLAVRTIAARTALGRDKILEVCSGRPTCPYVGEARAQRSAWTPIRCDEPTKGAQACAVSRVQYAPTTASSARRCSAPASPCRQDRISKWQDVLTASFLRQKYIEEQQSLSDIARQVGCSYQTVLDAVHRHGIAVRGGRSRAGQSRWRGCPGRPNRRWSARSSSWSRMPNGTAIVCCRDSSRITSATSLRDRSSPRLPVSQ